MKPIAFKVIISFLILCSNHNPIIAQWSNLDGNSYKVNLIRQGGRSSFWEKDKFIFKSGQMHSVTMKRRESFESDSYSPINSSTNEGMAINFTYDRKNKYGSSLKIEGTAQENAIKGTIIWTSDAGEHTYTFTGTLK